MNGGISRSIALLVPKVNFWLLGGRVLTHPMVVLIGVFLIAQVVLMPLRVKNAQQMVRIASDNLLHVQIASRVHMAQVGQRDRLVQTVPLVNSLVLLEHRQVRLARRATPVSFPPPAVPRVQHATPARSPALAVPRVQPATPASIPALAVPRVQHATPASIPVLAVLHARIAPRARTRTQMAQPPTPFARIVPRGNSLTPLVHL